jgi:hypothetical protein
MPVPLPGPDTVLLTPPDKAEALAVARGVVAAAAPDGGLTDLQRVLIEAQFVALTGQAVDVTSLTPTTPEAFAADLARRNLAFRTRVVQMMLLAILILRPLPEDVAARVRAFAGELGVDDDMIEVARDFADGALGLAAVDFDRAGYVADWSGSDATSLHTSRALSSAWAASVDDPELAAQWRALADLPAGTLGRGVSDLYAARGFVAPGQPGSAPPLLAQHDWVHVLADYGTTVESELEVFGFIARSNDDMRAFSLLAMVISLFETGYLAAGAGLFTADPGHLSGQAMAVRLSDAMRRGALGSDRAAGTDSVDYLRMDWFSLADLPVEEARRRFALRPKDPRALAAGSVGPWQPGGISPYQLGAGKAMAAAEGRPYDAHGATVG